MRTEREKMDKDIVVKMSNYNLYQWIIIWIIVTLGEPDLLDAIIHYLMK